MRIRDIAVASATLIWSTAHSAPVFLSCDMQTQNGGQATPFHFDFVFDADAGTVDNSPARITETQILFERQLSGGDITTTVISRVSGAFILSSKKLGIMGAGTCVIAQNRKF
jgi:hypothetical protein